MKQVLVVDDEQQMLVAIDETLKRQGYGITTAGNGFEALDKIQKQFFQAIITDVRMPELDGIELLREVKKHSPVTPVILLTGHGTVSDAVQALRQGAYDYLMKPFSSGQLLEVVSRATESVPSQEESNGTEIVSRSQNMKRLLEMAARAAKSDATILVEAESGTGKELLARYIHSKSPRSDEAFVAVNCAAVPSELLESELFGHEKGAFTGAVKRKPGKFELADKGTILLDEIGEMSSVLQAKLLRVLQEREIDPVGALSPEPIDVRVIATTNQDLNQSVADGKFRQDLYFRLNVIPLNIPPLRDRKKDISILVNHFCEKYQTETEDRKSFSHEAVELLQRYDWPGNVRELENLVRRATTLCSNLVVTAADLFTRLESRPQKNQELRPGVSIRDAEKKIIGITLEATEGNRTQAAKLLGISLRTLRNKLRDYRTEGLHW